LTSKLHITASAAMHMKMRRPIRFTPELHIRTPPFGVIFLEPRFRGVDIREHLDVVGVADLLARIHVNEHGHLTILQRLARLRRGVISGSGLPPA
jgi:hypothetical protein